MIIIGLTGSIAMGKSTTAAMLQHLGIPTHDSDVAVHELLKPNSKAMPAITEAFPHSKHKNLYKNKEIDRKELGKIIFSNNEKRIVLESILHPHVQESQKQFIRAQTARGTKMLALDIPLLFETGAEERVDYTITVTAPAFLQRARAFMRPGMNEDKLSAILDRQMSDSEKCDKADFVISTGLGRAHTMQQLKDVIGQIQKATP